MTHPNLQTHLAERSRLFRRFFETLILLLFAVPCLSAQPLPLSSWLAGEELKGHVKSYTEKSYSFNSPSPSQDTCSTRSTSYLDRLGNEIQSLSITCDGQSTKSFYHYDDSSRLVKITRYYRDSIPEIFLYEYDSKVRRTKNTLIDKKGTSVNSYTYDSIGYMTRSEWHSNRADRNYSAIKEYQYDKHGHCIHELVTYADDSSTTERTYQYDSHNNIILSITSRPIGTDRDEYKYEYDKKGRIVKSTNTSLNHKSEKVVVRYVYKYDRFGDLVQEDRIEEDGRRYRTKIAITRDKTGNWTKRVTTQTDGFIDIEERTIQYY